MKTMTWLNAGAGGGVGLLLAILDIGKARETELTT